MGLKKNEENNSIRDTGKHDKRSSLIQLKFGCSKLSMRIQIQLNQSELRSFFRNRRDVGSGKGSGPTSIGGSGTAVEYLWQGNVVELLTRHQPKGRWGQPRKIRGQERLLVESYQFWPSDTWGIHSKLCSELRYGFARKGDTPEFSLKWERTGQSYKFVQSNTGYAAVCLWCLWHSGCPECTDTPKTSQGFLRIHLNWGGIEALTPCTEIHRGQIKTRFM